jgi:hypothetical protein
VKGLSKEEVFMNEYEQYVITSYGKPFPGIVIVEARDVHITDMKGR